MDGVGLLPRLSAYALHASSAGALVLHVVQREGGSGSISVQHGEAVPLGLPGKVYHLVRLVGQVQDLFQ